MVRPIRSISDLSTNWPRMLYTDARTTTALDGGNSIGSLMVYQDKKNPG